MRARSAAALLLVLAAPLAGCLDADDGPEVVATFYPLHYLASEIAGPDLVGLAIPEGTEAHDWEPSVRDVARLGEARLVVAQGLGFEPWLGPLLANLGRDAPEVLYTAGHLAADSDDHDHGHGTGDHGHDEGDPHTWLDPVLLASQAGPIRDALARLYPERAPVFAERTEDLQARLAVLDASMAHALDTCRTRHFIVAHDAFSRLAARYDLAPFPLTGTTPHAEPDPATVQAAIDLVRAENITVVFVESAEAPGAMAAVARETGARLAVLATLEGRTPAARAAGLDYLDLMAQNRDLLAEAMGCA